MKQNTLQSVAGLLTVVLWVSALASAQQAGPQATAPQTEQAPIPGQPTMPPVTPNQLPENPSPSITPVQNEPAPQNVQSTAPSGTAAAQAAKPVGNAGSQPAGAAIAPPKQRQVRSFLIKLGAIAGAGAAIGTVYALTAGSPSRVPGSTGH
jgi:hypothetical protein